MDILSFSLGIASVVVIAIAVVAVYAFVKVKKVKEELDLYSRQNLDDISILHRRVSEVSEMDNRRIDGEINRMDSLFNNLHRELDSRFDKFENKLRENKQLLKS